MGSYPSFDMTESSSSGDGLLSQARLVSNLVKSSKIGNEILHIGHPTNYLLSVCSWIDSIIEKVSSSSETRDVAYVIFFEYLQVLSKSQDNKNKIFDDIMQMSKVAAVSVVLASKMHETGHKVLLQSFSF